MGHFTATTLGLLEAACLLALAVAVTVLAVVQTRRARHAHHSEHWRSSLREALRHGQRAPLRVACEQAQHDEHVREDIRVVARDLAPERQRVLLAEAARDAGLDDALRDSLRSDESEVRARAAGLLGLLRLASCAELEPLLRDPDRGVRLASARALAQLDTAEAARALIGALGDGAIDPAPLVEQLGRPSAAPELVRALASPTPASRSLLAEALGLTQSPTGIAPLALLVRRGIEDERIHACRALGRIARPEVVPLLLEALADDAWAVRAEAARGLTGLGDDSCVPELELALSDGAWWVRSNAADALRSIGPSGVDALVRASQSPDPPTAARAREALAVEGRHDEHDDGGLDLAA